MRDLNGALGRQVGDVLNCRQARLVEDAAGALAKAEVGQLPALDVNTLLAGQRARLLQRSLFVAHCSDQPRGRPCAAAWASCWWCVSGAGWQQAEQLPLQRIGQARGLFEARIDLSQTR